MPNNITVAAPTTLAEMTAQIVSYMSGQTGVPFDPNIGSQIRTLSEAFGQVGEQQGVIAQALAFQAVVYGCMNVFGITPLPAISAQGSVTFSTAPSSPPPATQDVVINQGTIVATVGGAQYQTIETVVLSQGSTSVNATVSAIATGAAGNTTPSTITIIVSGLPYPLFVSNSGSITGGANAEAISVTLSRFIAKVASIGLASPVAIANAAIGTQPLNSTETVLYATVYEPWVTQMPGSQTASFILYIDNGSGNASMPLIDAVKVKLDGNFALNQSGYRDAGVPYDVLSVVPVNYSVVVTGVLSDSTQDVNVELAVSQAVQQYETTLQFGQDIHASQITAVVGDVLANIATAFTVVLLDSSSTPQQTIVVSDIERGILTAVTVTLT